MLTNLQFDESDSLPINTLEIFLLSNPYIPNLTPYSLLGGDRCWALKTTAHIYLVPSSRIRGYYTRTSHRRLKGQWIQQSTDT